MTVVALPETIEGCWTRTVGVIALPLAASPRRAPLRAVRSCCGSRNPEREDGLSGRSRPRGRRACGWCPISRLDTRARFRCSLRSRARALARANAPCVASRRPTVCAHGVNASTCLTATEVSASNRSSTFSKLSSCCPDQGIGLSQAEDRILLGQAGWRVVPHSTGSPGSEPPMAPEATDAGPAAGHVREDEAC